MAFDLAKFEIIFAASLQMVADSEGVTKRELRALSRSILEAVHATGNIGYVNKLCDVLSPVNKKVARVFFKHFTGFHFDDKVMQFTKKSGKRYAEAKELAEEFLADPLNNIWTWADRNIEVSPRTFNPEKLKKYIEGQLKMAAAAGFGHDAVLKAVIEAGITADDMLSLLANNGEVKVKVEDALF